MKHVAARVALLLSLALVLLFGFAYSVGAQTAGQLRLGYATGDDWEPAAAADQIGHLYVLFPHYGGVPDCAGCPNPTALLQVSNDRGATWSAPRVLTPEHLDGYQIDMQLTVDPADGRTVYASWLQNNKSDAVVTRSTDFGASWSAPVVADSTPAQSDKPALAARGRDVYLGLDHRHRLYVAASHDGGHTFGSHPIEQDKEYELSRVGGAAIDSHGALYFAWAGYGRSGNARGPVNLYVSKSADGGENWTTVPMDTSGAPADCSAFSCGWAFLGAQITLTVDPNDTVYALWNAGAADRGPERIYFARSTDRGNTWTPKQDVSLAPTGVNHAFPAIVSGGPGDVRISWMDARNASWWNVFYRASHDAGATWSAERRLSGPADGYEYIDPNGFAFPYGDYYEMAVDDRSATHIVWGEGPDWVGPGTIWYARVSE